MTAGLGHRLEQAIERLPTSYPGPGGAVAVLQDGHVLAQHAWGWANTEQRIPFSSRTLFRLCSITKQFTCAVALDTFPDLATLDADVAARLPRLQQAPPRAHHLCHNQSGLRDYWAVAMLHGSPAEAPFGDAEAARVIGGARTLQFAPGTRYSYCNQNFRLLSDVVQDRASRSFAELLRSRIFDRAGMASAFLAADTRAMPDGTEGYEGSQATGFRVATNRVLWTGDAGLGASLEDMIAWERHIDATRDDPGALYQRLAAPALFDAGGPAGYGSGLQRRPLLGRPATGHGGALRGWRSHRCYLPAERLSVVVLFNHLADATAAVLDVLRAVFDEPAPQATTMPPPAWLGTYLEPETGLSVRIDMAPSGQVRLRYGIVAEQLDLQPDGSASAGGTCLRPGPGGLWMDRGLDNQSSRLEPLQTAAPAVIAGRYHCAELDAELTVVDAGGALYGAFSGMLGQGRMELLDRIGPTLWALPCPRALDHTPPGDWTLACHADPAGVVTRVEVGCWLARGLAYTRVP